MQLFHQLPNNLVILRHYKQKAYPSQLLMTEENLLAANTLLEILRLSYTLPRQVVEKKLKQACLPFFSGQVSQGLTKLLPNLIGFLPSKNNAEWRKQCFDASASYWKNKPQLKDPTKIAEAIWQSAPTLQISTLVNLQQTLYADLPSNHLLQAVNNTSATELLHAYNMAQWQGIMPRLNAIILECKTTNPKVAFQLCKQFKQAGLLFEFAMEAFGFKIYFESADQLLFSKTSYQQCLKTLPNLLLGLPDDWELQAKVVEKCTQFELNIQKLKFTANLGTVKAGLPTKAESFLKTYQKQLSKVGKAELCKQPVKNANGLLPDIKIKTQTQNYFLDWQAQLSDQQIRWLKQAVKKAPKNYWFVLPYQFKTRLNWAKPYNLLFFKLQLKFQDFKNIILD